MPYRDDGDALEVKLRGLLEARRELDAEIAHTYGALAIHRANVRESLVRGATRVAGGVLALIVGGVGLLLAIFVFLSVFGPRYGPSHIDSTRSDAATVRGAVEMYLAERPGTERCPTIKALVGGGFMSGSSRTTDSWGNPYRIECDRISVTVTSAGPDGQHGTEDDVQ